MKLSLQWLFDHIDADWQKIDISSLVKVFNETTAEIEGFEKISLDHENLFFGIVESHTKKEVTLTIPESDSSIKLPSRDDVQKGFCYLIIKKGKNYEWATLLDLHSSKEGYVPALSIDKKLLDGSWKKLVAPHDYSIHLDNKSVNHRPDLWGHRGVAREVAAMLKLPFQALDHLLIAHDNKEYEKSAPANQAHPISITIENPNACKRFSGLYFDSIQNMPSVWWMAFRLARVDSRPINALVDMTNYVMLDIGQPMHAFDADSIKSIVVRQAKNKEQCALLDGTTVALTDQDCVVTDGKKILALAGIMGGKDSGISLTTNKIFLEAACFDAATIRKSSTRIKKRTESSARFEKSLDPYNTQIAIERFLQLLSTAHISYKAADQIASVGALPARKKITISHEFIEKQLGIALTPAFIEDTLISLDFGFDRKKDSYEIFIPTFRATKDIAIVQDIVEEVGRFYGYSRIAAQLPNRQAQPFDMSAVEHMRAIKRLLAYGLQMQEVATYAFFDESFLNTLGWQPGKTLQVQEAVSENWQRLVTTLLPNLLKVVHINTQHLEHMSFFEWARQWPENSKEEQILAGIFVDKKHLINFYDAKQMINRIFQTIGIFDLNWQKPTESLDPWYLHSQSAHIFHNGKKIGTAGILDPLFFSKIASGNAFAFELDGEFLLSYRAPVHRYVSVSKYPSIDRDISMLVPLAITVEQIIQLIKTANPEIVSVDLVDFFEKDEWKDRKSLTFRIIMRDSKKTLSSQDADLIMLNVKKSLQSLNAEIR
jgi:phenylalanyl-tRNA synthetase beta chain